MPPNPSVGSENTFSVFLNQTYDASPNYMYTYPISSPRDLVTPLAGLMFNTQNTMRLRDLVMHNTALTRAQL